MKRLFFVLTLLLSTYSLVCAQDVAAAIDVAADRLEPQTIAWRRDFHERMRRTVTRIAESSGATNASFTSAYGRREQCHLVFDYADCVSRIHT